MRINLTIPTAAIKAPSTSKTDPPLVQLAGTGERVLIELQGELGYEGNPCGRVVGLLGFERMVSPSFRPLVSDTASDCSIKSCRGPQGVSLVPLLKTSCVSRCLLGSLALVSGTPSFSVVETSRFRDRHRETVTFCSGPTLVVCLSVSVFVS